MDTALHLLVDAATLARHLGDPQWVVFDCRFDLAAPDRGRAAYAAGHIPGARYAHLDQHLSGEITPVSGRHPLPDPRRLMAWLAGQGVGQDTQVVAYDDTGGSMGVRLWWLLRWLGHVGVAMLDGGWQAWNGKGFPTDDRPPTPAPRPFAGVPDGSMLLTTEEIVASLGKDRWLLIDARSTERFRGDAEPIDPVAGHIPGAVNRPLQHNLGRDGRFLPAEVLRHDYLSLLRGRAPSQAACMCGSGVTAVHDLLAMEIAGLGGARLYAGSWSEWIRDPVRPVAKGEGH